MPVPDPRWLDILKASGWQTTGLAAAAVVLLVINQLGWLPPLDPWVIQLAAVGGLVCGFLALASMGSALFKMFPMQIWILHYLKRRQRARAVLDYLPHMSEREKRIIGYLLARNQTMLTMASDGGYAVTLLSKGVMVWATQPGQSYSAENVPAAIPDYAWAIILKHQEDFPDKTAPGDPHPWRVSWMVR